MPYHRRLEEPQRYLLLSNRTGGGQFVLRPDKECCRIIRGCLARWTQRYNVQLVAYAFLSNHFHLVARFPEANCSNFMRDFQGGLSRRLNDYRDRDRPVFPKRFDDKAILGAEALLDRISYVTNNPVRHGLVARPERWPGVESSAQQKEGEPLVGHWLDHDTWHNYKRRQEPPPRREAMVEYRVDLHVPECLPGDSQAERRKTMLEAVESGRKHFCEETGQTGRRRKARAHKYRQTDWRRCEKIDEGWCDISKACVGTDAGAVAQYLDKRREIDERYRAAADAWKAGDKATFPAGTYPPGRAKCVREPKARPPPD